MKIDQAKEFFESQNDKLRRFGIMTTEERTQFEANSLAIAMFEVAMSIEELQKKINSRESFYDFYTKRFNRVE